MEKNSKPNPNPQKSKIRDPDFVIPRPFFNQLDEYSNGGYILIAIDAIGEPIVYTRFDNAVVRMGLQSFAKQYFNRRYDADSVWTTINDSEDHVSSGDPDEEFNHRMTEDDDDDDESPPQPQPQPH